MKPGDRVTYDGNGKKEYGVVVYSYYDYGDLDCYVTFFGTNGWPDGAGLTEVPYTLRYYATSLEKEELPDG